MKTTLLLACAAPLTAVLATDVTLEHAVDEGTEIRKTLTHEAAFRMVTGVMVMGDREEPVPDGFSMEVALAREVRVTDVYGPWEGGRPRSMTRTVTGLSDALEGAVSERADQVEEITMELETELVDVPVVWTLGERGYERAYADEECELDEALLEGLTLDLDGARLLPPAGADLAEGWTAPAAALTELLMLGGDLGGTPVELPEDEGDCFLRSMMMVPQLGDLDGEVRLALGEVDEEKGLATLTLEADLSGEGDAADYARRLGSGTGRNQLRELARLGLETEMTVEGTVVWDLRRARLARFDLDADVLRTLRIAASRTMGDQKVPMSVVMEFEGEASWEVEFEGR